MLTLTENLAQYEADQQSAAEIERASGSVTSCQVNSAVNVTVLTDRHHPRVKRAQMLAGSAEGDPVSLDQQGMMAHEAAAAPAP